MADRRRREAWFLIAILLLMAVGVGLWVKNPDGSFMREDERRQLKRIDDLEQRVERLERERDGGPQ